MTKEAQETHRRETQRWRDELQSLLGSNTTPDGMNIENLQREVCHTLVRIIKNSHEKPPESLWDVGGPLHNIHYRRPVIRSIWETLARKQTAGALTPATSMRDIVPRDVQGTQSARAARYSRRNQSVAGDTGSGSFMPSPSSIAEPSIAPGSHQDQPNNQQLSNSDTENIMTQCTVDDPSDQAQTSQCSRGVAFTYIKDTELLKPGKNLHGSLILSILRRAAHLNPFGYVILDPAVSSGIQNHKPIPIDVQERLASSGRCSIIAPIHLADRQHWVLLRFDRRNDVVHVYDSLSPTGIDGQVRAFILLLITTLAMHDPVPAIHSCHCPLQADEGDSGTAVIVNALDIMTRNGYLEVDSNKNYTL
ncbi:hypothetical protein GCG54_00013993 [Colletotrichum gloeosporioides]|uniref:Ubiquitin-like protease family profile domain-containing protein n=1 Tax=Colletotrichum gloeosporioides TaxID=474922 RepID=A0A8H4FJ08_COLGL|nr:uncharacterized protein GCG54_00013993 [Colletotrichum gloeosporioides]KAF3802759.1 hypothetical protein GCG54_00013993 [Colletotrichum gloeosporioides]